MGRRGGTLDTLLTYLLAMAEAAPADVRAYLEAHPYDANAVGAPPPARKTVPPSPPPPATPDKARPSGLEAMMQRMSLSRAPARAAAAAPAEEHSRADADKGPSAEGVVEAVPRGTSVTLVSVRGGNFLLHNVEHRVQVRGPVTAALDLDRKMDFHRLLNDAQEAGVQLEVTVDDVDVKWQAPRGGR